MLEVRNQADPLAQATGSQHWLTNIKGSYMGQELLDSFLNSFCASWHSIRPFDLFRDTRGLTDDERRIRFDV